jgi:hypothetical protein
MLRQALSGLFGGSSGTASAVLEQAGVPPTARGEDGKIYNCNADVAAAFAAIALKALTVPTKDGDPVGDIAWRPLVLIVAGIVVFGFALPKLGMVVSLPLLVLIASYAGDEFHLGEVLINSVVLTAFSWVIFIWGLNLTIPLWPTFLGAK